MSNKCLDNSKICELDGNSFIDNLNNISYYIGKISLERNCNDSVATYRPLGFKYKGNEIHKIIYNNNIGNGLVGKISRNVTQMTDDVKSFARIINPDPDVICIKDEKDNKKKYVYTDEYNNLPENVKPSQCGFTNRIKENNMNIINEEYRKKIYKLYLLGLGSLMVFLVYKLFIHKKN